VVARGGTRPDWRLIFDHSHSLADLMCGCGMETERQQQECRNATSQNVVDASHEKRISPTRSMIRQRE
jgi:hypothetical protein